MGKKKKAGSEKSGWKQVRIRTEWLDKLRAAHKTNPTFSPDVDLATMKEPFLLDLACRIAAGHISGWIWKQVDQQVQRIIQAERRDAILTVANHMGGRVETNEDGSLTVVAPRKKSPNATFPVAPLRAPAARPSVFIN